MNLQPYEEQIKKHILEHLVSKLTKDITYSIVFKVGFRCSLRMKIGSKIFIADIESNKIQLNKKTYTPEQFIKYINEVWSKAVLSQSTSIFTEKDFRKEKKAYDEAKAFLESEGTRDFERLYGGMCRERYVIEGIKITLLKHVDWEVIRERIGNPKECLSHFLRIFRFSKGGYTIGHKGVYPSKFKKYFKKALSEFEK